jgi:hypothetical protein
MLLFVFIIIQVARHGLKARALYNDFAHCGPWLKPWGYLGVQT